MRSETSLTQTCGRAARNVEGRVIFYGDKISKAMKATMDEVQRRRELQLVYNEKHGITPKTIIKPVRDSIEALLDMDYAATPSIEESTASRIAEKARNWDAKTLRGELAKLRDDMSVAANELRYEEAAMLRDQIRELEALELSR